MGKRNNRWISNSRSYRYETGGQLPPPYPAEPTDNSVPEWEKKFCYQVGSVPWRKVLQTKSFVSCYPDVMNWDDSEAKYTFDSAKRRFWAQMNGLRTDDMPLPDPNAYIDQIDWNASVDNELFLDLDRALLAANANTIEKTEVGISGVVDISALAHNSKWQEWNHGTADDVWDNGGCWDLGKHENGGWVSVNARKDMPEITKGAVNPWDSRPDETNVPVNDSAWGYYNDISWGWDQPEQFYSTSNLHIVPNSNDGNFKSQHGAYLNNYWGRNCQQNNFKETKGWINGTIQHDGASAAREWRKHGDHSQFRNSWNNNQHKKTNTYYKRSESQYLEKRGDRKRESPNNYATRGKSPWFQPTDNQIRDQREPVQRWSNRQSMQQAGSSFKPS